MFPAVASKALAEARTRRRRWRPFAEPLHCPARTRERLDMAEMADYPMLLLRRGEDRRLRAGHLWVFSNEVDVQRTPLDRFESGEPVLIGDHTARVLGSG